MPLLNEDDKRYIHLTLNWLGELCAALPVLRCTVDDRVTQLITEWQSVITGQRPQPVARLYQGVLAVLAALIDPLQDHALRTMLVKVYHQWQRQANPTAEFDLDVFDGLVSLTEQASAVYEAFFQQDMNAHHEELKEEKKEQKRPEKRSLLTDDEKFVRACVYGHMAAQRYAQGWTLLSEVPSEIKQLSTEDHRRFQQVMLRLFKQPVVLRMAQQWQAYQQRCWRPFRRAIQALNHHAPNWRSLIPRYRNLQAEKSFLNWLTQQSQTLLQQSQDTLSFAYTVEAVLTHNKRQFFKTYFAQQTPANVACSLLADFRRQSTWQINVMQRYIDTTTDQIQQQAQQCVRRLRQPVSLLKRSIAFLLLSLTRHAYYQFGYKLNKSILEKMDRRSQALQAEKFSLQKIHQASCVAGATGIALDVGLSSWIRTPYMLINLGSQTVMAQMDTWLGVSRCLSLPVDAYTLIKHEAPLRWVTGFFIQALGLFGLAALNVSPPVSLMALGMGYTLATGGVALMQSIAARCLSRAKHSQVTVPLAMAAMWFYGQGLQLGLRGYDSLQLCSDISVFQAINQFGWCNVLSKRALKQAYRRLSLLYHPDKVGSSADANAMTNLNAAYTCLKQYAF